MNIKSLLSTAVLALIATACTNDVNDVMAPEAVQQQGGIHFTATIAPKTFDANTRMLTEKTGEDNNAYLEASWAKDETVVLVYEVGETEQTTVATVTDVAEDGTATIEAEIVEGVADNTSVTLHYPGDTYSDDIITSQDGKLSNKMDYRTGTGNIKVNGNQASLEDGATLSAEYAIVKFKLGSMKSSTLNVKKLVIKSEEGNTITTIVPSTATSVLYAAMPENDVETTYWFEATSSQDNPYIQKGSPQLEKGKFYTPTLKMATVGDVILADGTFAKPKTEGAEAMIAYIGSEVNIAPHGLAIALTNITKNGKSTFSWDDSGAYNGGLTLFQIADEWIASHPVTCCSWRLPTVQDWQRMLIGCGSTSTYMETLTGTNPKFDFGTIDTLITSAGGTTPAGNAIWSTTSIDENNAWAYSIINQNISVGGQQINLRDSFFVSEKKTGFSTFARAILAF